MTAYLVLKALHLIAMVAWFAGLFYLPRLFVYHTGAGHEAGRASFAIMERKLYRGIMWPAMVATWLFGLSLIAIEPASLKTGIWLPLKLVLVVALTLYHLSLGYFRTRLLQDAEVRSERFFRLYNELPTLVLIAIVFLAVLRP